MTHHSDMVLRVASALSVLQFPHKQWSMLPDEEKGFYIQDTFEFFRALEMAGLSLVEKQDDRYPG